MTYPAVQVSATLNIGDSPMVYPNAHIDDRPRIGGYGVPASQRGAPVRGRFGK